jgi:soluble lytic murein transglycosylase-like protein
MKKTFSWYGFVFVVAIVIATMGFVGCSNLEPENVETAAEDAEAVENNLDEADLFLKSQTAQYRSLVFNSEEAPDCILEAYRNFMFQDRVVAFFGALANSNELAALILKEASDRNLSPSLVFALSWEESRFNHRAVNRNVNKSIDRGLFQLNSSSFPNLKEADFFDPETNTRNAMAHLRWCLDSAKSEVVALAMYNAGLGRVKSGGTPQRTLDYVSRILRASGNIEELFLAEKNAWILADAEAAQVVIEEPNPITLVPVDSLAQVWAGILSTAP